MFSTPSPSTSGLICTGTSTVTMEPPVSSSPTATEGAVTARSATRMDWTSAMVLLTGLPGVVVGMGKPAGFCCRICRVLAFSATPALPSMPPPSARSLARSASTVSGVVPAPADCWSICQAMAVIASLAERYAATASCSATVSVVASTSGGRSKISTERSRPKPNEETTWSAATASAARNSARVVVPSLLPTNGGTLESACAMAISSVMVVRGVA